MREQSPPHRRQEQDRSRSQPPRKFLFHQQTALIEKANRNICADSQVTRSGQGGFTVKKTVRRKAALKEPPWTQNKGRPQGVRFALNRGRGATALTKGNPQLGAEITDVDHARTRATTRVLLAQRGCRTLPPWNEAQLPEDDQSAPSHTRRYDGRLEWWMS